jgi:Leucine-rich repeat (LRR) protein
LEKLFLDSNRLESIPSCVQNMYMLAMIRLNSNRLVYLPDQIGDLPNINWITYFDNPDLKWIPESIRYLDPYNNGSILIDSEIRKMRWDKYVKTKLDDTVDTKPAKLLV